MEYMEYAGLLKQASGCDDPLRRLEVANFVIIFLKLTQFGQSPRASAKCNGW